jgi:hypothetical protein
VKELQKPERKFGTPADFAAALQAKSARARGVPRLYRFQKYDANKLALMLGSRVIRASDPAYFNDPYDCRPVLGAAVLESPGSIDGLARMVRVVAEQTGAAGDPQEEKNITAMIEALRANPEVRRAVSLQMSKFLTKHARYHRLICLARNVKAPLLWSHYGDAHRGMCFEFDATKEPFSNALEVKYEEEFPQLDLANASVDAFAQITLLTKAKCWEYEDEYRLIASERADSIHARCHKDLVDVPPGTVTGIILGHKTPPAQIDEARYLISRFDPSVKLCVLSRVEARYDLALAELALDRPVLDQLGLKQ